MTKPTAAATKVKTPAQVRAEFERNGISVAEWARAHGVSRAVVYQVLAQRKKGLRGQSHKVAVLLGMKVGLIGVDPGRMAAPGLQQGA